MTSRRPVDLGLQSSNETQYVFSEGDGLLSDADVIRRTAVGRFYYPIFQAFVNNILCI